MTRTALGLAMLAASLTATACIGTRGSGTETMADRSTDGFHAIEVGGAITLDVTIGSATKVVVRGDDNIVPLILTEVEDGVLSISTKESISPELRIRVEVTTPNLDAIDASGACDIAVRGLQTERFDLELSGASDVFLSGEVESLTVDASGASDLSARKLQAKRVAIDLSGAGNAEIFAGEALDLDISGAANVEVWGSPSEVTREVSGAGSVELHDAD